MLLRGRRQVGKSRLITEFLARSGARSVYFQAARRPAREELASFAEAIGRSNLTGADLVRNGLRFTTWESAFEWIARTASPVAPVVVVLDELPYLTGTDPSFESVLQLVWDHTLQGRPVLLVVVGSDLATMEAVTSYDRPLYGRVRLERAVLPLNLAEVADVLGLEAPDAVDAYLTVGGFPRVLLSWAPGRSRREFVRAGLSDPTSALVVIGERMLAAEFPDPETARAALEAVGHGERSFGALSDRSGLSGTSLHRALALLRSRRVIEGEDPLSTARGGRATRYRVADPYLRFWLRFVGPALADVERGRADLAVTRTEDGWPSYRGRAVEPLVRQSLERLARTRRGPSLRRLLKQGQGRGSGPGRRRGPSAGAAHRRGRININGVMNSRSRRPMRRTCAGLHPSCQAPMTRSTWWPCPGPASPMSSATCCGSARTTCSAPGQADRASSARVASSPTLSPNPASAPPPNKIVGGGS